MIHLYVLKFSPDDCSAGGLVKLLTDLDMADR